jgi:ABC-type multidrug transport system fused ATPase/permease subunit
LSEYLSTFLVYFKLSRIGYNLFSFLNQRFLIELFYNKYITGVVLKLGGQTTKLLDKGSVEYIGPFGLEKGLFSISSNIAKLNTGVITSYALYMLVGLVFYMLLSSYINGIIMILVLFTLLLQSSWGCNNFYQGNIIKNLSLSMFTLQEVICMCNDFLRSLSEEESMPATMPVPDSLAGNVALFVGFMFLALFFLDHDFLGWSTSDVANSVQRVYRDYTWEFFNIEERMESGELVGDSAIGGYQVMQSIRRRLAWIKEEIDDTDLTDYSPEDAFKMEETSEWIEAMLEQTIPVMQAMANLL